VEAHQVVEGLGHLAGQPGLAGRQADGVLAGGGGLEAGQQLGEEPFLRRDRPVG
jgi:hypothetical protein